MTVHSVTRGAATLALTVLFLMTAGVTPAAAESIRLGAIGQDDVITVIVSSWGCFGYRSKHQLTFRAHPKVSGAATVDIVNVKGILHRSVGTRVVPAGDLAALDAGLDVYRKASGGCISTHITRLRLRLKRKGGLVAEEMHYGNRCSVDWTPGALDLETLIFRDDARTDGEATGSTARHNHALQRTHSRVTPRAEELHESRRAARR